MVLLILTYKVICGRESETNSCFYYDSKGRKVQGCCTAEKTQINENKKYNGPQFNSNFILS